MSAATQAYPRGGIAAVRNLFRDQPILPLTGLLVILVIIIGIASPGIVNAGWAGVILRTIGSGLQFEMIPNSLIVFVPVVVLILLMLRRTGYGRLLYAIGDNETAARLSGARSWQVLIVLYVMSALLAGIAGLVLSGATNTASVSLADQLLLPSVAAAVIGGTSIFGGRGGYGGTIVGALILTVLAALLTVLGLPEPTRQIVFGAIIVAVAAAYTRVTGET